jgi:hypothetical protein
MKGKMLSEIRLKSGTRQEALHQIQALGEKS